MNTANIWTYKQLKWLNYDEYVGSFGSVRFDSIRFGTICKQLLRFPRIFVNLLLWKLQRQQQEEQWKCCKTLTMLTKSNLFIANIYRIRTLKKHRALAFIGRNETKTKHLRIFSFVCFWLCFLALLQPAAFSSWFIWAFQHFGRKSLSMPNANHLGLLIRPSRVSVTLNNASLRCMTSDYHRPSLGLWMM